MIRGGAVRTGGFRGVELAASRGATAQRELDIDWNYPVYTPPRKEQHGRSRAPEVRRALDPKEVYAILSGEDPRPLLVLREFSTYDDPGNEKLTRKLYTERTVLLSHWFNCVRLPHHVIEENHPFHALFQGGNPPQLFLASPDGSKVIPFDYLSPGSNLEKEMSRVLSEYYVKNPVKVVGKLLGLLPRFDKVEWKIQDLKENLDRAIESAGPASSRARKLRKELERAEAERKKLEALKKRLRDIPLKNATRTVAGK